MRRTLWALWIALAVGCATRQPHGPEDFRRLIDAPGPEGTLVLTFFEVGLGDAILLELPGGRKLLVDAGIGWYADAILNYLEARGIRRLDGLLLTHPHLDHFGGMRAVVESLPVGAFYHNGVDTDSSDYRELLEALEARFVPAVAIGRGGRIPALDDAEVRVEVLYPDGQALRRGGDLNRGSIVLRLTHRSVRILLMGDSEREEELRLLELEKGELDADLLKLGHHASPGSGDPAFLAAVRPRIAIAQGTAVVDFPPWYPRPSFRIPRLLRKLGTEFLTTEEEGAIQVISDGASVSWRSVRKCQGGQFPTN